MTEQTNYPFESDPANLKISEISDNPFSLEERVSVLKKIFSFIDFTTLEGSDNNGKIISLCDKAKAPAGLGLPVPAAVCVYPPFVRLSKRLLEGTTIKVASVAGAFPSGQSPLHIRVAEVKYAVEEGADEIDMVISRGKFLEGDYQYILDEVAAMRDITGNVHLKVILETGELSTLANIRKASELAISAGADFIKTSTGKTAVSATPEAVWMMAEVIKAHHQQTGKKVGLKPAGGISTPDQAITYYRIMQHLLGEGWLQPDLFRIGASRLADLILKEIS